MESAYLRIFIIGFDNITEELPYIELTTVRADRFHDGDRRRLLGMVEEGACGERLLKLEPKMVDVPADKQGIK